MRLVLFSDLHLDAQFAWLGAGAQAARERRMALRQTLGNIVQLTKDVGAEALLCGGDLYEHEHVLPDTTTSIREAFRDLDPIPAYLAPGNHDWYGPQSAYAQVKWSANVHVFTRPAFEPMPLAKGVTLWGAAHAGPASTANFLQGFSVQGSGVQLALFHGSVRTGFGAGAAGGEELHVPFDSEDISRAGLHHAFLGHYHQSRAPERYTYPGNPDPLAFGETGVRGAVVAEVAMSGVVKREWKTVSRTLVQDLRLDVSGATSFQEIKGRVERLVGTEPTFTRVTLHGELHPDIDLRERDFSVPPGLHGLLMRIGDVRPAYDFATIAREATVKGTFVRNVLQSDGLLDTEKRRVLVTGLRALEGRGDLEVR
jgi:DNA repair exonuclease SbcCD nuclease subunit